jgi:hypothetical protein
MKIGSGSFRLGQDPTRKLPEERVRDHRLAADWRIHQIVALGQNRMWGHMADIVGFASIPDQWLRRTDSAWGQKELSTRA